MMLSFRQGKKGNKIVWARVPDCWHKEIEKLESDDSTTVTVEELDTDDSSADTLSVSQEDLWKNWSPASAVSSDTNGKPGATVTKKTPAARALRRVAKDGKLYSRQQFLKWYGGVSTAYAISKWEAAAVHGQVR